MAQPSEYELEIEGIASEIRKARARLVCIQLPAGLKMQAADIQDALQKKTRAEIVIWGGSCFGACDIPNLSGTKIDLLVQWGHSELK
ncbi:hypothetical protein COV21_02410 [Candidatus Woesearchaeota archaeon CG10_big_fil_rev_8_21_14_0_10_45_5]|nr:MAG: hypothetical protein COV21_02410 [Candidatus Woesearchaeota archaeon CG10_big_fil_rev_8_21_14_0_10_45_5]PIU30376.1 MAG: hypothetical protein COT07_01100 [Candidatus Woesearchaeota archaeon CG07_land_8_20_14_0_80_44_23]